MWHSDQIWDVFEVEVDNHNYLTVISWQLIFSESAVMGVIRVSSLRPLAALNTVCSAAHNCLHTHTKDMHKDTCRCVVRKSRATLLRLTRARVGFKERKHNLLISFFRHQNSGNLKLHLYVFKCCVFINVFAHGWVDEHFYSQRSGWRGEQGPGWRCFV